MTKLDCNVSTCLHNADNCCCRNAILVEGASAAKQCDTCCGSFNENRGGSFKNMFRTPEKALAVDCEATNCFYNSNRHCVAEHIGITGGNAKSSRETECSTFRER